MERFLAFLTLLSAFVKKFLPADGPDKDLEIFKRDVKAALLRFPSNYAERASVYRDTNRTTLVLALNPEWEIGDPKVQQIAQAMRDLYPDGSVSVNVPTNGVPLGEARRCAVCRDVAWF